MVSTFGQHVINISTEIVIDIEVRNRKATISVQRGTFLMKWNGSGCCNDEAVLNALDQFTNWLTQPTTVYLNNLPANDMLDRVVAYGSFTSRKNVEHTFIYQ